MLSHPFLLSPTPRCLPAARQRMPRRIVVAACPDLLTPMACSFCSSASARRPPFHQRHAVMPARNAVAPTSIHVRRASLLDRPFQYDGTRQPSAACAAVTAPRAQRKRVQARLPIERWMSMFTPGQANHATLCRAQNPTPRCPDAHVNDAKMSRSSKMSQARRHQDYGATVCRQRCARRGAGEVE